MGDIRQSDTWQANLEVLRRVDPSLAERLANLPIPPTVQPAIGRDDQPTYRIQRETGQVEWFGRTSMPTISAEGLLGQFNPGGGNVVMAGIGSGLEAKLLSERLARHRATIVLETEPLNLALALRLWDLSGGLGSSRIILVLADDLPGLRDRLVQMCQSQPGLELPTRMLAWPWRSKVDNQPWQTVLEEAVRQVNRGRSERFGEIRDRLCQTQKADATADAVAVLTTAPGQLAGWASEALVEGACAAGFEAAGCWPDSPLQAGHLAGLTAISELAGRCNHVQIVLVDQVRNHWPLRELSHPLVSWLVAAEQLDEAFGPTEGREDRIVTTTQRQREQLLALGWPAGRVLAGLPFISPKAFEQSADLPREGILLLHDLTAEDPEEAGITLYSHKILWQSIRQRLNGEPDGWQAADAMRWLLAAQAATGTDLADPAVQEQFAAMVQRHLAPSVILARAAKAIIEAGLPLRIAGTGWNRLDWAKAAWNGPVEEPGQRADLLRRSKVVVLGDIRPGQAWLALEAAAAGAVIIARSLWPASDPAALLAPGKEMLVWAGQQELTERLRYMLRNDDAREQMVQRASGRALEQHSTSVRLRQVVETR